MAVPTQNTFAPLSNQQKSDGSHSYSNGKSTTSKQKRIHRPNLNSNAKSKNKKGQKKKAEDKRTPQQRSDDYARFICLLVLQHIVGYYHMTIYSYSTMLEILL
jgi:hypothetical protein